ncbi:dipeptide transport system permease protein [Tissierella praeacuta DSM 18095]|uniref:Dipeptide transport system permease protein n=1 Tax=Tissierella praeacuta DSM 18095 TaxID=1123404 RepID=A0A1M4WKG1_9FIRM|nr:ABC transporter permease [Tissierella praeacuta]TCU79107.1 dipeptide transport system permease protein [Tissierella praeacuta]SHE81684.1 dipeptide transport system permease protein [Tissierella praeacuta DSM 18095]SUO99348.1 Oligopeptide transport system permease protein oppC [Tissierella praeacuta]
MESQTKLTNEFTKEMFEPASSEDRNAEKIRRPSIKYWPDVWRRLKQNKLAMTGLIIIALMIFMSIVGPLINGFSYFQQDYAKINLHPNSTHWFGTDELGRDQFTRVWYGARYSLIIGILAAAIDFIIGVIYGGIAGISTRRVDSIMMRIAEVIYSIPYLLIVILLSVAFSKEGSGTSLFVLILAMTLTDWVPMAILVRGQVLQLKESEYSLAAESLGAPKRWILRKHIIPNTLGPILVNITLTIPRAIFAEATLGFLGLGFQAPKSSLGSLANDGLAGMAVGNSYQIIIPAIFISLIMFAFNVLGDGLRDALDPRLRK